MAPPSVCRSTRPLLLPPLSLPLLLLLLLLLHAHPSHAQKRSPIVQQVFSKPAAAPPGWTAFNPKRASRKLKLTTSTLKSLPAAFRSVASSAKDFSYVTQAPPGIYTLILGFAELDRRSCKKKRRIFSVSANSESKPDLDVFAAAGCRKPYTVSIRNLQISKSGKLVIALVKNVGSPILANFQLIPVLDGALETVYDIDAGGITDLPAAASKDSRVFPNVFPIKGANNNARFSKQRFSMQFAYTLKVRRNVIYDVTLFFAEAFVPNCSPGKRVFSVAARDAKTSPAQARTVNNVDIFARAGCRKAYMLTLDTVLVGKSGVLVIEFSAKTNMATVSAIKVTTADGGYVPSPSPTPFAGKATKSVKINAGATEKTSIAGSSTTATGASVGKSKAATQKVLQSLRFGSDFQYQFNLKPGKYIITLSFAELFPNFCSKRGNRIFNVSIDGAVVIKKLDIFREAGCFKGLDFNFRKTVRGKKKAGPVTIRFTGLTNNAQINYIQIKSR